MRGLLVNQPGEYPVLAITDSGWRLLKNRETLSLPDPTQDSRQRPGGATRPAEYDSGLYEKLRGLRRQLAAGMRVPPYVVFGDVALQQMAYYLPQSNESFLQISGVGEAKLAQFGDQFLSVVRSHAGQRGLTEKPNPKREGSRPFQAADRLDP